MNIWQFSLAYLTILVVIVEVNNIYFKIRLRYIDNTTYKFYNYDINHNKILFEFEYKGHKITIDTKEESMNKPFDFDRDFERKIFIINGNDVACISKSKGDWITQRYIRFNNKYNTKDFYKILKTGRKAYNKNFNKRFNEEWKVQQNSKLNLY